MLAPYINTLTYLLTLSRLEYSIRYSTEYSSSKKLDSHTATHKSTFGVYYRTGSPGQLGLRVAGFPGHWVAGSQNVTQFHVWYPYKQSRPKISWFKSSSGNKQADGHD